jgi:hypothetical protein
MFDDDTTRMKTCFIATWVRPAFRNLGRGVF